MTKEKEMGLIQKMDADLIRVLNNKASDYAGEDVLSNFKRVSTAAKALNINVHTPKGYALFMSLMKIDRINNLLSQERTPSNESVEDSFGDGVNYFKLAWLCYIEQHETI